MYSVNPMAAAGWKALFAWLARQSQVDLRVIDHAFPLPLAALWSRPDLACGFMCGYPFALAADRPLPLAAPVPASPLAPGQPVYATRLVVRAESEFRALEDTFGGRLGYTTPDSHSGYNALRRHLLKYRAAHGERLYRDSVGPLFTPRRVIEALFAGAIDVGPLDSYALDLMLRHEPDLAPRIRIIATTEMAPIPFLVAAKACPADIVAALRAALASFGDAPECAELRDLLCLRAFAPVIPDDYDLTLRWDAEARAAGYGAPL
jgi:ABC-type phosphate/phosphonate transport system substrate-binding protein